MSKFVVLGANGGTGLEIVARLVEKSLKVVAVVRNPSKASSRLLAWAEEKKVDLVAGDVTDRGNMEKAIAGSTAVFFAASGKGYDNAVAVDQIGAGVCAELAKAAHSRIVLVSSQLVHPSNRWNPIRGFLNSLTGLFRTDGLMDLKFKGEQLVRRSGAEYVIVRPGQLVNGDRGKNLVFVGQSNGTFMSGCASPRADVAAVCVEAATASAAANTTFEMACRAPTKAETISEPSSALFGCLKARWGEEWK